jgi:hypothetical protein
MAIICPKCGKHAKSTETKYGVRNYCCNLWSWGNSPLVDKKTHRARRRAHETFDVLWKKGFMSRTQAYVWLSKALNLHKDKCHMKQMDYDTAKRVVRLCRNFEKSMNF